MVIVVNMIGWGGAGWRLGWTLWQLNIACQWQVVVSILSPPSRVGRVQYSVGKRGKKSEEFKGYCVCTPITPVFKQEDWGEGGMERCSAARQKIIN